MVVFEAIRLTPSIELIEMIEHWRDRVEVSSGIPFRGIIGKIASFPAILVNTLDAVWVSHNFLPGLVTA
jgi:hypothetical protein